MAAQYVLTWSAKYDAAQKLEKAQRYMEVLNGLLSVEDLDPETAKWVVCQAAGVINDVSLLVEKTPARPSSEL